MPSPETDRLPEAVEGGAVQRAFGDDTIDDVPVEDKQASLFEARTGGEQLRQDVFASAALFQHLAEATDLALDAGEAVEQLLIGADV